MAITVKILDPITLSEDAASQISSVIVSALNGANNPSASNVFATIDDLDDTADQSIKKREESEPFTLSSTDSNSYIRYTGATDFDLEVPNTLNEMQPITIFQAGAGVVTLVAGTGITALNGPPKTPGQNLAIQTMKVADGIIDNIGGVS